MTKGKLRFKKGDDGMAYREPDEVETPGAESFLIKPSRARRQLTRRDQEYNDGVQRLFERVTPGLPVDGDTIELRREADAIGTVVEAALKRLNVNFSPWLEELREAWPGLVGEEVAAVARPGKVENGILFVYVTTSLKLFELRRFHLREIEKAVDEFGGDQQIRQVRLMVNSVNL